jgi:adenylate cyclase
VIPLDTEVDEDTLRTVDVVAFAIYVPIALVVGAVWGSRRAAPVRTFLQEEREPTDRERRAILMAPLRVAQLIAILWAGAVVVFGLLNGILGSLELGASVAITVAFGGITTCAMGYLLAERLLRATAARALAAGPPERTRVPGVAARSVIFWALGTGVPLLGLILIAIPVLTGDDQVSETELAVTVVALGGIALLVGLLVAVLASRATADPIESVRDALARVERGNLDAEVPVYDASEVGLLQSGFNRMVAGLRERERIRETFGAYVDPDVAEHILRDEGAAEGEEVEVTLLFCDVRGFTSFAERSSPREVVSTLNELFESAVPIVREHGGHIDKFIGDGFLAVFGSPTPADDHADRAVEAAIEIARVVRDGFGDDLEVGLGVNSGSVIAGSLGGAGRLEYSVIGDAVNVAARVEAATRETGDGILISEETRSMLRREHELRERPGIRLKGKSGSVSLYAAGG